MKTKLFTLILVIMFVQLLPAQEVEQPTGWKAYLLTEMKGMVKDGKKLGGEVIDQLKVQVPDLVNQLLWWEGIRSGLWFLVGIAALIMTIIFFKSINKMFREDRTVDEDWRVIQAIVTCLFTMVGLVILAKNLIWLKILIAPKLFLFQYFAEYIK